MNTQKWIGAVIVVAVLVAAAYFVGQSSNNQNQSATQTATNQQSISPKQAAPSIDNTNQPQNNSSQITASDIAPYIAGVVEIICKRMDASGVEQINDTGSGSLWSFPNGTYDVVTNEHVIAGDDRCIFWIPNANGVQQGTYYLDLSSVKKWNSVADEAAVPVLSISEAKTVYGSSIGSAVGENNIPINQLNFAISSLRYCPASMPVGSPVTVIGYPAFAGINNTSNPAFSTSEGSFKNQITTNGVISGNYSTYQNDGLPDPDYYISATIDSGNSGGVAFSKNTNGICLLGIPTWITLAGNFTNEGIVQNINNIMYSQ